VNLNGALEINLGDILLEPLIKGTTFQGLYNAHVHIGNSGYNTGVPVVQLFGTELSLITNTG
jgi:hypothetical protein